MNYLLRFRIKIKEFYHATINNLCLIHTLLSEFFNLDAEIWAAVRNWEIKNIFCGLKPKKWAPFHSVPSWVKGKAVSFLEFWRSLKSWEYEIDFLITFSRCILMNPAFTLGKHQDVWAPLQNVCHFVLIKQPHFSSYLFIFI